MENKGRKVDLNMWGYVRSLTDPIEEHKETMNLDLDFKHLQRVSLGKSYFNYYKMMSKPLRMAVNSQPFDTISANFFEIFSMFIHSEIDKVYRIV